MPNCSNCGAEINGAQKFCGVCGAPVSAQPVAAPTSTGSFKSPAIPQPTQGQRKSKKKILIPIVCALLVAVIGGGGWLIYSNLNQNGASMSESSNSQPYQPPADAPPSTALAHEHLFYEADTMMAYARMAEDSGVTLQAEYVYGHALAPVSALRFCLDNILWLKGEGETVEDIVSAAPYGDWNEIVAVGLGSPMPFYFEGLLYDFQDMTAEATACYKKAEANPNFVVQDFNYLKSMSVDDLYELRSLVVEKELAILDEYTPRAHLYAERTGAEFAPEYHMALAGDKLKEGNSIAAAGSCLNAVIANPHIPDCYATAILLGSQTDDPEAALFILNEGLWAFPSNGEINYAAAMVEYSAGNTEGARAYLQTAQADAELSSEFSALCEQLLGQIGG